MLFWAGARSEICQGDMPVFGALRGLHNYVNEYKALKGQVGERSIPDNDEI